MSAPALATGTLGLTDAHPARSAVTDAYIRLTEVYPGLSVRELGHGEAAPEGDGWVGAAGLAAGGADLDTFLAWDEAQVIRDYGQRARPDVVASFGLHRYAWPACLLITVPWFLLRRVPRLPVERVTFQRTLGRMAVRVEEFACLPDDPAARLPGARVVPDEEALRAEVRAAATEHLDALRRTLRTGLPMSADFTVRQGGALVLVAIVARLGVTAVAAYSIAYKVMYVATMAFYAVRQAASIHTAHTRGTGRDERGAIGRQAVIVSGAVGLVAAVLLGAFAPWITRAFGAGGAVAHDGVLFLRCVGPYLLLMACFIALGGVFEGSGGAPLLLRVTVLGTAVQLPLAYALSGLGLPGICLALALSMAVQCTAVGLLLARARRRQEELRRSLLRVA
ncbi:MATE family efflux transporter [Streptomyces mirabilis]